MTDEQKNILDLLFIKSMKYEEAATQLKESKKTVAKYWNDLKEEREKLLPMRTLWKRKCKEMNFWGFKAWYEKENRVCHYCKVTEEEIKKLKDHKKIETKRLRGYKLEIERKNPKEPYSNFENLTLSCYWCNNAKTDEFTEEEFLSVGAVIGKVWQKRLKEITP